MIGGSRTKAVDKMSEGNEPDIELVMSGILLTLAGGIYTVSCLQNVKKDSKEARPERRGLERLLGASFLPIHNTAKKVQPQCKDSVPASAYSC